MNKQKRDGEQESGNVAIIGDDTEERSPHENRTAREYTDCTECGKFPAAPSDEWDYETGRKVRHCQTCGGWYIVEHEMVRED